MKDNVELFDPHCRCHHFVIVDAELLDITLGNIVDPVSCDVASIIVLVLTHQLAFQGVFSLWKIRVGDENKDIHIDKTFEFVMGAGDLVFTFR